MQVGDKKNCDVNLIYSFESGFEHFEEYYLTDYKIQSFLIFSTPSKA